MSLRIKKNILLSMLTLLILVSCDEPSQNEQEDLIMIKDMLGRTVEIPARIEKVVGLRAGALRFLVYMGAVDKVAGIEENERRAERPYLMAYPKLKDLPVIGPAMGGEAEMILQAQPDVIFISYTTKGDADALQQKTGIPVVAIECPEFGTERNKLFRSFQLIGQVLNKKNRADSLINYINRSIEELTTRTKDIPDYKKPSVYIGAVSYSGQQGITSTQPYYPPFMFVNARNVASDINERLVSHVKGTFIDKEQLMIWDPEVLFIDESGLALARKELSENTALYNSLSAVEKDNVYILLPHNNYATNYELVLANAWYVGKVLYPEKFSDINIDEKANEISQAFLGKSIYNEWTKSSQGFRSMNKEAL